MADTGVCPVRTVTSKESSHSSHSPAVCGSRCALSRSVSTESRVLSCKVGAWRESKVNSLVRIGIEPSRISEFRTQTAPQKTAAASKEGVRTSPGLKLQMALRENAASIAEKSLILSLTTRSLRVLSILSEPGYDPFEVCPSTRRLSLSLATIDEYQAARFVGTYITERPTKLMMDSSIEEYLQPTRSIAEETMATVDSIILIPGVGQAIDAHTQNLLPASLLAMARDSALSFAGTKPLPSP